jgi:mannose-6-phosphate isomerase-like protein (cupin superfamily)
MPPLYTDIASFPRSFAVTDVNLQRPWGGYWCIDPTDLPPFVDTYFSEKADELHPQRASLPLSPKILFVLPQKRLSWQYHHRRAEWWKVVQGPIGIVRSTSDEEGPLHILQTGTLVEFQAGERHRLVGLAQLGIVAELWQHLDPAHPSDEEDTVRLQDDFGR